jgi:hypothetical protein
MIGLPLDSLIKAAVGIFKKFSTDQRNALLVQAHLLDHIAEDCLELRDNLRRGGPVDLFLIARAEQAFNDVLYQSLKDAPALVSELKKAAAAIHDLRTSLPTSSSDIEKLGELAGFLKGLTRTMRTIGSPPNAK